MDKSSRELLDSSDRRKFPKNNFFNYRWRVLDNFSKSIDRHLYNIQATLTGGNTKLSERILQGYQAGLSGSDSENKNNDLIGDLAQDAMQFLDQRKNDSRATAKSDVLVSKATSSLIDRTFKLLLGLSTELNSVLGFSDLSIRATEPAVTKRAGKSETSHATCVQSSIFTGMFRLLIEGKDGAVSFYLIPTANLSAMMEASSIYPPFTTWSANFSEQGQVYWITPDGILTEEMLDRACAELIRILVETTQEEIAPGSTRNVANADTAGSVRVSEFNQADPWVQHAPEQQTQSVDGTRTDSVPSLGTMYKDSGIFDTVDYDYTTPSVQSFFESKSVSAEKSEFDAKSIFDEEVAAPKPAAAVPKPAAAAPKPAVAAEDRPAYEFKPMFETKPAYEQKVFEREIKPQEAPPVLPASERASLVPPMVSSPAPLVPPPVERSAPLVPPVVSEPESESAPLPIPAQFTQTVVDEPAVLQDVTPNISELQGAIVGSDSKSKSEIEKSKSFDLKTEYYAQAAKPVKAAATNKRASRNKSNTRKNRKNKKK